MGQQQTLPHSRGVRPDSFSAPCGITSCNPQSHPLAARIAQMRKPRPRGGDALALSVQVAEGGLDPRGPGSRVPGAGTGLLSR